MNGSGRYPHVRVKGGAMERGRQYGDQAKVRVQRSVEGYAAAFRHYAGWSWSEARTAAMPFEACISASYPSYLEEMRGIAEGAGVDFIDILTINVRTEVMFAALARQAGAFQRQLPAECSAFALLPYRTETSHTVIGQTWDWLVHCFETVIVLEVEQDEGPDFVTVVEAGLLAKAGMNSAGLAVCTNALVTEGDQGRPGIPYHVLLRALIDCETITDALVVAQLAQRSSSANFLLAHRDGTAIDLETTAGDYRGVFPLLPEHGVLLHTNHFLSPRVGDADVSAWAMPSSLVRLCRLQSFRDENEGRVSQLQIEELLQDHAGHPSSICSHPDLTEAPEERGATVASLIMDLDESTMSLADGNPCETGYRTISYREFMLKDRQSDRGVNASQSVRA
jgi:isopenicillin-N N-acyltransferase-like protein